MKKYKLSTHALQRAAERLGISNTSHAVSHVNSLMTKAFYMGEAKRGTGERVYIYDHPGTKTRILINESDIVVTVYRFRHSLLLPDAFHSEVMTLITRRYKTMEGDFKKKQRALEIELAEFNLEKSQLELNQVKAKSPKTQAQLQAKIDEVTAKVNRITFELDENRKSFEQATSGIDMLVAK